MIRLKDIDINKNCKILKIISDKLISDRLIDVGFIPGNIIKKVFSNPFGNINAYYIMGTTIAIRNKDIEGVLVEYE